MRSILRPHALAAVVLVLPFFPGCGGADVDATSITGETGGAGGGGGATSVAGGGASPVSAADAGAAGGTAGSWQPGMLSGVFAFDAMWIGDVDRSGHFSPDAWKSFGIDFDGSTTGSPLCQPWAPADLVPFAQGPQGQDNRVGQLLGVAFPSLTTAHQTIALTSGRYGLLLAFAGSTAELSTGAPLPSSPAFDGEEVRPAWTTAPASPMDFRSLAVTWTDVESDGSAIRAHAAGPFTVWLFDDDDTSMTSPTMLLVAREMTLLATVSADGARLEDGTLAGLTRPGEWLVPAALCGASTLDPPKAWADQGAPGSHCESISFGFGFTAARIAGLVPAPDGPPPGCP